MDSILFNIQGILISLLTEKTPEAFINSSDIIKSPPFNLGNWVALMNLSYIVNWSVIISRDLSDIRSLKSPFIKRTPQLYINSFNIESLKLALIKILIDLSSIAESLKSSLIIEMPESATH